MSTNYYVTDTRTGNELHFGKSSVGWAFNVRQHPDLGLETLYDWLAYMTQPAMRVSDEYRREVTVEELLRVVMHRPATFRGDTGNGKTRGEGTWDYNNYEFC